MGSCSQRSEAALTFAYSNMLGEKTLTGTAALDLGEAAGFGTIAQLTPAHAYAKADALRNKISSAFLNDETVRHDMLLRYIQHVKSVLPRSVRRLGLEALCKHVLQANIQITFFAMHRLVHNGRW